MSASLSHVDYLDESDRARSGWDHGTAHFRAFAITICFLLMAAALGLTWLKQSIHNELRNQIVAEMNHRLQHTRFDFELGDARWSEGHGLRLVDLRFRDKRSGQVVVECQQVFAESSFQLTDVLSGKPTIDALTVDAVSLFCEQDQTGAWNIVELMGALKCEEPMFELNCPIQFRNSSAYIDGEPFGLEQTIAIRGVNCDHRRPPGNCCRHELKGFLSADVSHRLEFELNVDQQAGIWTFRGQSPRIEINDRLTHLLKGISGSLTPLKNLRGQVALGAVASGRLGVPAATVFEIAGRAQDLQCPEDSLPYPVHDGSFEFRVDNRENRQLRIRIQEARLGLGDGTVSGGMTIVDPLGELQWRALGAVTNLQLSERMLPWMKPEVQRAWHQFQPAGEVDVNFDIRFANGVLTRNIRSTVRDGSISWYRFPFRVSRCNGSIDWIGDDLTLNLTAIEAQQLIKIAGEIQHPGSSWTGWLEGVCEGNIPINEKLLQAFDVKPELARTLRKFNATGHLNGRGRIERVPGSDVVKRDFHVHLRQATVRHTSFDYPIYNVNGLIHVENEKTDFRSLYGQNNNGQIECNGTWTRNHGLQLRFLANNVLLNDELRDALPPNLQKTWSGLRPSGTVEFVDLDLHTIPGNSKPLIGVTVEIPLRDDRVSPVSINPVWFPYEMRQVTGNFRFENQRIDIRQFAAKHGKTTINANGSGAYNETSWRLRLSEVFASNIVLDDELRHALPAAVAEGLDRIRFAGNLGMQGAIELTGAFQPLTRPASGAARPSYVSTDEPLQPTANLGWNLEFGIARASANPGLPVTNANGLLRLRGRYAAGQVRCFGKLHLDSLMYRDIQVTSLTAPLSIDNQTIAIGRLAATDTADTPATAATARLFGGYVECDGQVKLDNENKFFLQAQLTDGKLEEFATEVSMQPDFSGQAFAGLRLRGNASGVHSLRGDGYIQLRNARIYEVPVILALLNVLRIKEPDRTAFDEAQMEFTVNGENFDFQKIELNGDAISLIGQGSVNMDSEVNLDFYTMMGRNRWFIPVVTKLYQAGSKQVWWVKVDGTLDNPQTQHEILPGLNDSLKLLFPELEEAPNQ